MTDWAKLLADLGGVTDKKPNDHSVRCRAITVLRRLSGDRSEMNDTEWLAREAIRKERERRP